MARRRRDGGPPVARGGRAARRPAAAGRTARLLAGPAPARRWSRRACKPRRVVASSWCSATGAPSTRPSWPTSDAVVVVLRDVSRYTAQIDELRQMAERDPLTGLLNRRAFLERGKAELARGARNGRPVAVAVADVDRFAQLNDLLGQTTGDAVLAADRPAAVVEPASRPGRPHRRRRVRAGAARHRSRGCAARAWSARSASCSRPSCVEYRRPRPSRPACTCRPREETLEMALYRADEALEAAKLAGRARVLARLSAE